jgi:ATP-dependent HslUV protease ATP-binding subunit HslU
MIEQLLEEISFSAPDKKGESLVIDGEFVRSRLVSLVSDSDMRRYLL